MVRQASRGAIGTERELIEKFTGILGEQAGKGKVLAGWNIGYGRRGQGFDIDFFTRRAAAYGLAGQAAEKQGDKRAF